MVGRRRARSVVVERLDAGDLGLSASTVGLAASPTKVAHMEPVPLPDRSCLFVGSDGLTYDGLVRALADVGALAAPADPPVASEVSAGTGDASPAAPLLGDPSVWVVSELIDGKPARVSLELLSKATELAPALGGGVAAVVAGDHLSSAVDGLARHGVDVVFVAEDEALDSYRVEPHARVIARLVADRRPTAVLFGATTTARPRLAGGGDARHWACRRLHRPHRGAVGAPRRSLRRPVAPDPAGNGGWRARHVRVPGARPQMATVRPGVFAPHAPRRARIEAVSVALERTDLQVEVIDRETSTTDIGLAGADVIIAGGAGCGASSWHLVEELADTLGGRVAAPRGQVEAGLAPRPAGRPDRHDGTSPRLHRLRHLGCSSTPWACAPPELSWPSTGTLTPSSSTSPTSGSSPMYAMRCRN